MEFCVGDKKFESYDAAMQAMPRMSFKVGDKTFYDYKEASEYEASLASAVKSKRYYDAMHVMAAKKPNNEMNYYFCFSENLEADEILDALIQSVEGSKKRFRIPTCSVVDAYEVFKPQISVLHLQSLIDKVIAEGDGYYCLGWDDNLKGDVYIVNMLDTKVAEKPEDEHECEGCCGMCELAKVYGFISSYKRPF